MGTQSMGILPIAHFCLILYLQIIERLFFIIAESYDHYQTLITAGSAYRHMIQHKKELNCHTSCVLWILCDTHGVDASGKLVCSIEVRLGGGAGGLMVPGNAPDGLALRVESVGLWHRRMGHINGKSLDVLRKEPTNGVDYTGEREGL